MFLNLPSFEVLSTGSEIWPKTGSSPCPIPYQMLDFHEHLARVGIVVLGVGRGVLVDAVVGEVHVHVAHTRAVVAVLVRRKPAHR